jgi:molybdenum cofactor cytidylyltransferase
MQAIECLIPAAGRSERMGRWKLVLPFEGSTIIETCVGHALRICARVLLVTGYRASELAALFAENSRVLPIENPEWERGMFSSIQRGIEKIGTERFFIALGDMPFVGNAVFNALLRCPPADAVFPVYDGRRGHPALFHERVKGEVLRADPANAKMAEIASRFSVYEMPWRDDSILRDIDREEDLK